MTSFARGVKTKEPRATSHQKQANSFKDSFNRKSNMSTSLFVETSSNIKVLTRRDSKDSCYSEEMDLSSTSSNSDERGVSPLALSVTNSPVSRKNSVSGDSGVSMDCFGDLCKVRAFDKVKERQREGRSDTVWLCSIPSCSVVNLLSLLFLPTG